MEKTLMHKAWIEAGLNPDNYSTAVADAMRRYAKMVIEETAHLHDADEIVRRLAVCGITKEMGQLVKAAKQYASQNPK